MRASFFPEAIVYKQWRQLRGWLIAWALFTWAGPVHTLVGYWTAMQTRTAYSPPPELLAQPVIAMLHTLDPHVNAARHLAMAALVVGVVPMAMERARGRLLITLAAPIRRRDLLATQIAICLTGIWGVLLVLTLFDIAVNKAFGTVVPTVQILAWFLMEGLQTTAAFAVGFAVSIGVGPTLFAMVCALLLALVPSYAAMMTTELANMTMHGPAYWNAVNRITQAVESLSPIQGPSLWSEHPVISPWHVGLWYAVWSVGWLALAFAMFRRLPLEREGGLFSFDALWDVLLVGTGLMAGTVLGLIAVGGMSQNPQRTPVLLAVWILVAALTWLTGRLLLTRLARRARRA
ncbi:hypothetical protein [Alicyclobacillus sp.]|uniref:hypothetical protein n=1 Tax=Alicyclobacillus sp. TaxID=61169 RepID=UPI0025C65D24|nr:hypothetical protein [Alicyclobacillus sp.]MCL6516398.1 hypothetical protein [Alicyclobacillus sp.]